MSADTALTVVLLLGIRHTLGLIDLEHGSTNTEHLVNKVNLFVEERQDSDFLFDNSDVKEGLIGQLFGQGSQSFPESTCQTEYTDIALDYAAILTDLM